MEKDWIGIIVVVTTTLGIMLIQSQYKKNPKLTRRVQYALGAILIAYLSWVGIQMIN